MPAPRTTCLPPAPPWATCASSTKDGNRFDIRVHRFANTADATKENATRAKNVGAHTRWNAWIYGVIACGERTIACRESALHVTNFTRELAHQKLGFDLVAWMRR